MERRFKIGFMNVIKWLVAGLVVLGAIHSGEYALLMLLIFPAIIELFTLITIFDRDQKLDFFNVEGRR